MGQGVRGARARFAYLLLFALTIGFSAFIASGSTTSPRGAFGDNDMIAEGLSGVLTATIVAAVIGVVAIGNEYGSGMIVTTMSATPRRSRIVLAKAAIVLLATTVAGTAAAWAAYFTARPLQRAGGFVAPGYPDPDLTSEPFLARNPRNGPVDRSRGRVRRGCVRDRQAQRDRNPARDRFVRGPGDHPRQR